MLDFLRIRKSYVYECINDGKICGHGYIATWFFCSGVDAFKAAEKYVANYSKVYISNFRRVY